MGDIRTYVAPLPRNRVVVIQVPPDLTTDDLAYVFQFLELLNNVLPEEAKPAMAARTEGEEG